LLLFFGLLPLLPAEEQRPVLILEVKGTIDPAVARYVLRGLEDARRVQASAVVLEMDTPGGLDGSMRKIIQALQDSPVPVIAYIVSPETKASPAAVLIAQAAHVMGAVPEVKDREDLLRQAEGRQVKTVFGATALALQGQPRQEFPVSLMEKVLHQLAHPNLAYILLLLGIYGLIYELATPGAVFPGVVGAIFLVLALVALETLEVNWGGIALIALSLIFFVADIKLPGYGALTAGGIIAFSLGSAILFPGVRISHLKLPWTTIGAAALLTSAFFLGIVGAGVRALRQKVTSGTEGLIGSERLAQTGLGRSGMVHVKGEDWQARTVGVVRKGARVRVVRREGLTVHVEEV